MTSTAVRSRRCVAYRRYRMFVAGFTAEDIARKEDISVRAAREALRAAYLFREMQIFRSLRKLQVENRRHYKRLQESISALLARMRSAQSNER
jgi:hypothetical protein